MRNKQAILEPDAMYHVYNRANGSERLFNSSENYRFFLRQYQKYIAPIAETWCYCLMPNHFHFVIRVKNQGKIEGFIATRKVQYSKTLQGFGTLEGLAQQKALSKFLTQQFAHLFNAYTQSFNKLNNRKGSLFMHPYKRKRISSSKYLQKLIHYIHYNPVQAELCEKPQAWPFSSFPAIVSKKTTLLNREEVLSLFGGLENFTYCHHVPPQLSGIA